MIELRNVDKTFDKIHAVNHISAVIKEGTIFGLVGANGAGKSTLLKLICGILSPEDGEALIDGEKVYENPKAKAKVCFLQDNPFSFLNGTAASMRDYYAIVYPKFDKAAFNDLLKKINLDPKRKVNTFSKGMKKQLSVLLGMCTGTKYLLCDETFDGLDPLMRQAVKGLFASKVLDGNLTPVIASHNLRELEDICDNIGLLYNGRMIFTKDLDKLKLNIHKIQCVLKSETKEKELLKNLEVLQYEKSGSLLQITARGEKDELLKSVKKISPIFAEILPLSLEEIFISETEVAGYDIKNLLL